MCKYRFRLLRGVHQGGKEDPKRIYYPGEIIETDNDLAKTFNRPPNSIKFEPVSKEAPTVATPASATETEKVIPDSPDFDAMSVAQLRELAEAENIDIEGAATKGAIVNIVKDALGVEA